MTTFLDALTEALVKAGAYASADVVRPSVILWPDGAREWERLAPRLTGRVPLFTLGPYDRQARRGPACWLRCVIAGLYPDLYERGAQPPIFYLPGVSHEVLRDIAGSPDELKPLMALQYSGTTWLQANGKDWTVAAFIVSKSGLGIEMSGNRETRDALARALDVLADRPLAEMRQQAPLNEDYFDGLLVPDVDHAVLRWLSDPDAARNQADDAHWEALCSLLRRQRGVDPEAAGVVTVAGCLGRRQGHWEPTWQRYARMPQLYPGVAERLRAARPTGILVELPDSWPQDNAEREGNLRGALLSLAGRPRAEVVESLRELDAQHGERRDWVWATLGQAPLAFALTHLTALAEHTARDLAGATVAQIAEAYTAWGWQADRAALQARAQVSVRPDVDAVEAVVKALYVPWVEQAAQALQQCVSEHGYSAGPPVKAEKGVCLLFCDALRMDLGRQLEERLAKGYAVTLTAHLAALPTVTDTAKPAVMPVAGQLTGMTAEGVTPRLRDGASDVTAERLRELLLGAGYQVLAPDETGDPTGRAWTELGNVDELGHKALHALPGQLPAELDALVNRVADLLAAGWQQVLVLTDHGWLLQPGMPTITQLKEHLTTVRKGRFARLVSNATVSLQVVPWHWDEQVHIALAPAAGSFLQEGNYRHGGLSPQECVTPLLRVQQALVVTGPSIASVGWQGLRCVVQLADGAGAAVDLRTKPGDSTTSLVGGSRVANEAGRVSLPVEDDDMQGMAAVVVVLSDTGQVQQQRHTTVGGD